MSYLEEQPKQNSLLFHATLPAIWPIKKRNLRLKPALKAVCTALYTKQCQNAASRVRVRAEKRGKSCHMPSHDWLIFLHLIGREVIVLVMIGETYYAISQLANQRHSIPNLE